MPRARILGLAALVAIPFAPAAGRASTPSLIAFSADRQPLVSYEIYRLDPNGNRVNLSQSPDEDDQPVVSPDGKKVAFVSYRDSAIGQGPKVFEVGIDGTKLRNMAPSLIVNGSVAWQPHGDRLAVIAVNNYGGPDALWILRWGHKPVRVLSNTKGLLDPTWSPDGRVLVAWSGYAWRAFGPAGRGLWTHESKSWGGCCGASWSAHGLLAVTTEHQLRVYDESGHTRFKAPLRIAGRVGPPAWSPNGREVGVAVGGVVEVRTAGGRLVLRKPVPILDPHKQNGVTWASDSRLVTGIPGKGPQEGVNVRTSKLWSASNQWFDPRSADGKLAAVTSGAGASFAIGVAPAGGGPAKLYGPGTDCGPSAGVRSLQFAGHGHSLVYESWCDSAYELFSMAPDGTGIREIAGIEPNVFNPVLSPDGTQVAYEWTPVGHASCGTGCGAEIRVANTDGTNTRVLAQPDTCAYDGSPTWSPDGKTILFFKAYYFTKSGTCTGGPGELYTVPAVGGSPPQDLGVAGYYPAWGPDRIAYEGNGGLTTANPDGSDPVVVTTAGVGVRSWTWSPDGRLAYLTGVNGTTLVVGGTTVQLPFAQVSSLSWSPDGTRFVVTAQKTHDYQPDVYTVDADGTDPVRLTTSYNAGSASWR